MKQWYIINGWAAPEGIWTPFLNQLKRCANVTLMDWAPAEELIQQIQAHKHQGPIVLCGWSLGAMEALHIAYNRPDLVENLVLFSASSRFVSEQSNNQVGWASEIIQRMIDRMPTEPQLTLKKFYKNLLSPNEIRHDFEVPERYRTDYLIHGLKALLNYDLCTKLADINIDTFIFHGTEDYICPLQAGLELHSNLSGSRFVALDKTGHLPFYTQSDICFKVLIKHLGDCHDQ